MIRSIILVALGGAVGSVCRYLVSLWFVSSFPWGTLIVNVLGALFIGLLVGIVNKDIMSQEMKLLLVTGFCGGITTFSTFANESFTMMKVGDTMMAALYIATSVITGIMAVWLGMNISEYVK